MNLFDICVITASNAEQAHEFESILERRLRHGLYPKEIDFRVIPDPPGGRCGSCGGTLWALLQILEQDRVTDAASFLKHHRILMIHAGGESRRLPCYAPEGKVFAPIPVSSNSVMPPVVLDLQLGLFLRYPWRSGELVIASGDAIIDFDTDYLPEDLGDICGFAKPASLEQGSRHGVFVFDAHNERVIDFHQKADTPFLAERACIRDTDQCALDIGLIAMSSRFAESLASFADVRLEDDRTVRDALRDGEFFFDVYLDLMVACLPGISFDEFELRTAHRSKLPSVARRVFYDAFHCFPLHGALTRKTAFIHMGSLVEYPSACTELQTADILPFYTQAASPYDGEEIRPQRYGDVIASNSRRVKLPQANRGEVVIEGVRDSSFENAAGNNVFSGVTDWHSNTPIPQGVCIDQRMIDGSIYRLVYGVSDTFSAGVSLEEMVFCGCPMPQWLEERGLTPDDLWTGDQSPDLLSALLFCPDASEDFTAGYWRSPDDRAEWAAAFRSARRLSITQAHAMTNVTQREESRIAMRCEQLRENIVAGLGWRNVSAFDIREAFSTETEVSSLRSIIDRTDDPLLASYRRAHLRRHPAAAIDSDSGNDIISFVPSSREGAPITVHVKEDEIVWARSPLRLDLAGGWSDTPPYTMRFGGRVVNVAVDLNGQPPIQVFCRRTPERHVRLHSIDLGVTETITESRGLLDYRNPASPFALPKAALCLLGLVTERGGESLPSRLAELGCGIEVTLLCAVPKGSGLGTSSILGGVILAALARFFGRGLTLDELFLDVLELEQMLTTGGGWQDQVGGIAGGVKYIECRPGLRPWPVIQQVDPYMFEDAKSHAHFTLYYTGITRLAKNILQDVVSRVNEATPAYLFTHDRIQSLATKAREAISLRSVPRVARIMQASWKAKQLMHPSTTNDEVEELSALAAPYSAGMTLLGAGGGGYALFASPSPDDADRLRDLLDVRSSNGNARVVQFAINKGGLAVSTS